MHQDMLIWMALAVIFLGIGFFLGRTTRPRSCPICDDEYD